MPTRNKFRARLFPGGLNFDRNKQFEALAALAAWSREPMRPFGLELVPKKLSDFFDQNRLQLFDFE